MKLAALTSSLLLAAACSQTGDGAPAPDLPAADASDHAISPDGSIPPAPDEPDAAAPPADDDPDDLPADYRYLCDLDPPPGAPSPPPPPAYSGGECPELVVGRNSLLSGGATRELILVAPDDMTSDEKLPVVFLWHHLGSEADTFLNKGILQAGINSDRFIAVLPEAKGDLWTEWPWGAFDADARVDEELRFFDDMLSCVVEQFGVNRQCVANGGVSTGGMWNAVLTSRRSEYLSSSISVSGGVGDGVTARSWGGATHKLPTLLVWGGTADVCVVYDFNSTSLALESSLASEGHAIVECVHNCGHSVPPFEAGDGETTARPLWQFVMDHPYWLSDGNSPYRWHGIPSGFPEWCGLGAGGAVPRTGACAASSACGGL